MARGWESKSVESQQEAARDANISGKPRLTREEADQLREKESLRLSLKRIVEQLARSQSNEYRKMLAKAKADLEVRIEKLG